MGGNIEGESADAAGYISRAGRLGLERPVFRMLHRLKPPDKGREGFVAVKFRFFA